MSEQTVQQILSLPKQKGDVGIEIEMEGPIYFESMSSKGLWRRDSDGSLRGESAEYVLKKPVAVGEVGLALEQLKKHLEKVGSTITESYRAGVHVHINVQEMTIPQVVTMACVYYALEDSLVRYCGPSREGNFFCMRLKDAEAPMFILINTLRYNNFDYISTSQLKYGNLNLSALLNYGSLEFRSMETKEDLSKIHEWALMLHRIKEYSLTVKDRVDIPYEISSIGPENWAEEVLGKDLYGLIATEDTEKEIISCVRRVQPLIYEVMN